MPGGTWGANDAGTNVCLARCRRERVSVRAGPARRAVGQLERTVLVSSRPAPIDLRQNRWPDGADCRRDFMHRLGRPSGIVQRRVHDNIETNLETLTGGVRAVGVAGN